MNNTLLVIIDPQHDFINKAGFYAKKHLGIEQILHAREQVNKLVTRFDKASIVVVISDYQKDQFEKGLAICIPGTVGHTIDINVDNSFTILSKTEHSCFSSAAFNTHVVNNSIHSIVLCGFLAEYCVQQTAIDGLEKGYRVSLLADCIGTGDDVQHRKEKMLMELKEKGAEIVSDEV